MPRIESKAHPALAGSYGPPAREWLAESFGMVLRGWQAYAIDRILEHDEAGMLLWPTVIVTVSRQQGKSYLARGLAMWRTHHPDLFGEDQLVLHVANRVNTAMEVMRPAGLWVERTYGKAASVKWGNQAPGITLPNGSRWLIQAANESAGVGYSVNMVIVDEAWNVRRQVVEGSLGPTMSERLNAQLLMISTAGDSESDLLISYRQRAIDKLDSDDPGPILLLEWSAPHEADPDAEATWRWASPEWSDKRLEFLRNQWQAIDPGEWCTQYLNQWVNRIDHWLTDSEWAETKDRDVELPEDAPWSVAVESEFDWTGHAVAVAAVNSDGLTVVRKWTFRTVEEVDAKIAEIRRQHPRTSLVVTPGYRERIADRNFQLVGRTEAVSSTAQMLEAFKSRRLRHDGDQVLLEHLLRSRIAKTNVGWYLSVPAGKMGVYAARAVMFAIGESSKAKATPLIHIRKRA